MNISPITRARQRNQAWTRQGFSQSPDFWDWFGKPLNQPRERPEPPKAKIRRQWRRPLFPVEAKKFWREMPEWLRFFAATAVAINLVLAVLTVYYGIGL